MNQDKLAEFAELYESFKPSEQYEERKRQKTITPVFKEIIKATLEHEPLANQHLTDLIQIFKYNCSNDNFDNKLEALIEDKKLRESLSEKAYEIGEPGYTNAGKTGISGLPQKQLNEIKQFLLEAFTIKSKQEAVSLCRKFDALEIPQVKKGIYSPWLFYINPDIFPIVNNSHKNFKDWLGLANDYPTSIEEYHELNNNIHETDFGGIDYFAHHLTEEGKLNYRRKLYLNSGRLYKISHGVFVKRNDFAQSGITKVLEQNNWISLSRYTGKGAGSMFEKELKIGDFVYLCYGGDKIISVAKVISDAKPFSGEHAAMLSDEEEEWIYREIEPLYFPIDSNIADLKSYRSQTMPSGNSTFWEIKSNDLDTLNEALFIPKFNLEILKNKESEPLPDDDSDDFNDINTSVMTNNSILFGPPGTGKTVHSISHAVAIVENKSIESIVAEEREQVKNRFDQYVINGQIVFCTFHQSLSYEDFIEGIKPVEPESEEDELFYTVIDGIFKTLCTEAAFSFVKQQRNQITEKALDFSTEYDKLVDVVNEKLSNGEKMDVPTRSGGNITIESVSQKGNLRVRHIDGTKSYGVSKKRLSKISQAYPDLTEITNIDKQFRAEIGGSNSSAYWAVLNAIRNQPSATTSREIKTISEREYSYEDKKEIIESLKNDDYKIDNPKRFVLIIDEINRGNVSQIFGELITLIEDDKRLGKGESLKATLPYSKDSFGVPCNIYIIGTMNTADRSVEALDTALRRRFSFLPMTPKPEQLKKTLDGINLREILNTLNYRLSILKDSDHTIGHAWLWNVDNIDKLKNIFSDKILPLLQEYFYNDYEKLGLVLGDPFFEKHVQVNSNVFASFSGGNGLAGQYDQTWQYRLKPASELTVANFQSLETLNTIPETDEE